MSGIIISFCILQFEFSFEEVLCYVLVDLSGWYLYTDYTGYSCARRQVEMKQGHFDAMRSDWGS